MKRMIVLLSVMLAFSSWVLAAEKKGGSVEPAVSMEQAIEVAKKEVPGKVILSVLTGEMYTIRIKVADGTVTNVKIDATTGAVVKDHTVPHYGDGYRRDIQNRNMYGKERSGFSKPGSGKGFKKGFGDHKGEEGEEEDDD